MHPTKSNGGGNRGTPIIQGQCEFGNVDTVRLCRMLVVVGVVIIIIRSRMIGSTDDTIDSPILMGGRSCYCFFFLLLLLMMTLYRDLYDSFDVMIQ